MVKSKNIKKYIENSKVYLDIDATDKDTVIRKILKDLKSKGLNLAIDEVIENIYKKEALGTSGLGYGVAFPHTYIDSIDDEMIIFATSKQGIIYNSIDSKPVHLIIMFLTPKKQSSQYLEHLSILAKITHFTMHVVLLLEAKTRKKFKEEIITFIDNM